MIGYAVAFLKNPEGDARDESNLELISFFGFELLKDVTDEQFDLESIRFHQQAVEFAKEAAAEHGRTPVVMRATTDDDWVRKQMREEQGVMCEYLYARHRDAGNMN